MFGEFQKAKQARASRTNICNVYYICKKKLIKVIIQQLQLPLNQR